MRNMEFCLSKILSSSNYYKIINPNKKELVKFAVYPDYNNYVEENMMENILYYIKELDFFPVYIHVVAAYSTNFESDDSTTKIIKTMHFEYFYTIGLIKTLEEFIDYFPDAYSDATNGQMVVISSEKDILSIDPTKSGVKFKLSFHTFMESIFYLIIHADGDCWDFISNMNNHPFEKIPICEED